VASFLSDDNPTIQALFNYRLLILICLTPLFVPPLLLLIARLVPLPSLFLMLLRFHQSAPCVTEMRDA
jgi:hypothetical protein